MAFDQVETSRAKGKPVHLYLFKGADTVLEGMLRGVTLIPGTTEFGYGTTEVVRQGTSLNALAAQGVTDFVASLDDLQSCAGKIEHVSLVVAWHGNDLRAGNCLIKPKVETALPGETPYAWQVGPVTRPSAGVVSQILGRPACGGAPSDRSVFEAITELKARGLRVTLYPFIYMDIPSGNTLPNPYANNYQSAYPWRGRITCYPAPGHIGTVDQTAAAATQVAAFFGACVPANFAWDAANKHITYSGNAAEWSFRRFILHLARIAAAAGGVDSFLLGSELIGLTSVRSAASTFPAVTQLVSLAADVRSILGSGTKISYAADWSEYHSYRPGDGTGDVYFNLDPLWADANIDFVGVDNYLPIADWRDGTDHLDYQAGWMSTYDRGYLQRGIESGEDFDWYYATRLDRDAQVRSPITDGVYNKPWTYRNKDFRSWWGNAHYNRPAGVQSGAATAWVPQSKPIVFTELGCPAINKGANEPNVFFDPKSSESSFPYYSSAGRDDWMQRSFLEAWLDYWRPESGNNPASTVDGRPMIDWSDIAIWTWDARPYATFPERSDFWGDAANWERGHWLSGRIAGGRDFDGGVLGPYAYTDAEKPITHDDIIYQPIPIDRDALTSSGTLDKATIEVRTPQDSEIAELFKIYPPAQVVSLIIRQGHLNDPDSQFLVCWAGRVLGCSKVGNEAKFTCEPVSTSIRRPGLRRRYQYGCPHFLYGSSCRAIRSRATNDVHVTVIEGNKVTLAAGWAALAAANKYLGGMLGWANAGTNELRTILKITGNVLTLSGIPRGLEVGATAQAILGCNHQMDDCSTLHANIHNFGGQPWIPLENPIGLVNNFY